MFKGESILLNIILFKLVAKIFKENHLYYQSKESRKFICLILYANEDNNSMDKLQALLRTKQIVKLYNSPTVLSQKKGTDLTFQLFY